MTISTKFMNFPPLSTKFVNFSPIFVQLLVFLPNLHFLASPILTMMYPVLHVLDAYEYGDWLEPNFLETQARI